MTQYKIELAAGGTPRLIKNDNPKAERPFDGGHIHYEPESYPATICSFSFGDPIYAAGADPLLAMPVGYPKKPVNYTETIVSSESDWQKVYAGFARIGKLVA